MEQTLIIAKPDAVQRGLVGEIVGRFERRGLRLAALKLMNVSRDLAERHYGEHVGKGFYEGLVSYITSGPVVVGVVAGPDAIKLVRATVGATRPAEAAPGSIRGDLASDVGRNLVHASDSPESAAREIGLFFQPDEIADYELAIAPWVS